MSIPANRSSKPGVFVGVGVFALALGVAGYTLLSGTRYANSEDGLRGYLESVQQKQLEYQLKHAGFAAKIEDLTPIGLADVPEGFTVDYRGSSPLDYCWLGKAQTGKTWFTVSKLAIHRTILPKDGVPPVTCAP